MESILNIWPTTADLAEDLGVPYTTAASWKARGGFPAWRDIDLVAAARKRGGDLTLEQIAQARRVTSAKAS
jgi:hypothetical protein